MSVTPITTLSPSTEKLTLDYNNCKTTAEKCGFLELIYDHGKLNDKETIRWMWPKVSNLQTILNQTVYTSPKDKATASQTMLDRINLIALVISSKLTSQPARAKRSTPEPSSSSSSSSNERSVIPRSQNSLAVHTAVPEQAEITPLVQAEMAFYDSLCKILDEPNQNPQSTENILKHLKLLLETCDQNKKQIALKIAEIYSNTKYNIINLDEAKKYYQMAREAGCDKSLGRLILIASKLGHHEMVIDLINDQLRIPPAFLDKEIPSNGITLSFNNENDKMQKLRLIKLLAKTFSDKGEEIIETRLLDLAVVLGDAQIEEYLNKRINSEHKSDIENIQALNNSFFTYAKSGRIHQVNFARTDMMKLFTLLNQKGFIHTSKKLFQPLFIEISAYEALSYYSCYEHKSCKDQECPTTGIMFAKTVIQMDSNNSLAAWVLVALNRISKKSVLRPDEITQHALVAQNGGYPDPRIDGATLYQKTSQPSCSSLSKEIYDDLRDDLYLGDL